MSCHCFNFWNVCGFEDPSIFESKRTKVVAPSPAQFSRYNTNLKMSTGDFRVADISLADFGRKEIEIAEHEVTT